MTEETTRVVREIRQLAGSISTYCADYNSSYNSNVMKFETRGRIYFQQPDKVRSEILVNGRDIVCIRNGTTIQRYAPGGKEVWQYDLKDFPRTEPINFGIASGRDPFFAVDEDTLTYTGIGEVEAIRGHVFAARMKLMTNEGLLDTRKGFSLRYQPKAPAVSMKLVIDPATGLLLGMVGTGKDGTRIFQATYAPRDMNVAVDPSFFAVKESRAGLTIVEMKDILLSALDPDYADQPPSLN